MHYKSRTRPRVAKTVPTISGPGLVNLRGMCYNAFIGRPPIFPGQMQSGQENQIIPPGRRNYSFLPGGMIDPRPTRSQSLSQD